MKASEILAIVPTLDDVRSDYEEAVDGMPSVTRRAWFDNWLAAHDAEIRKDSAVEALEWMTDQIDRYYGPGHLSAEREWAHRRIRELKTGMSDETLEQTRLRAIIDRANPEGEAAS